MTTIAVNKSSMACDLQFTYGGQTKFKGSTKIVTLKPMVAKNMFGVNQAFIGFAGNADIWSEFVAWISDPDDKPPNLKKIEFLMLTDENKIYHASNIKNWMEIKAPHWSIGSGQHLALAAMDAGKTPKEAVAIASKHDPATGMGIKEYKLD